MENCKISIRSHEYWVTLLNNKYYVDTKIEFIYDGEHGKTLGAAFFKWIDDSNEYGKGESQQLTFRANCENDLKKQAKEVILEVYRSLDTKKIITDHLKRNLNFFANKTNFINN